MKQVWGTEGGNWKEPNSRDTKVCCLSHLKFLKALNRVTWKGRKTDLKSNSRVSTCVLLSGIPFARVFTRLVLCDHWFSSNVAFLGSSILTVNSQCKRRPYHSQICYPELLSFYHFSLSKILLFIVYLFVWVSFLKYKFRESASFFSLCF